MSAAGALILNCDLATNKFVYSQTSQTEFLWPSVAYGDVIGVEFTVLQFIGIPNQFSKPTMNGMGIEFRLTDVPSVDAGGATAFVTQYSWTADTVGQKFTADISFNTTDLATWLSTAQSKTGMIRFVLVEGSRRKEIYRREITVYAGSTATPAVAAGSTPLSYERAVSMFAPLVETAGAYRILTSPSGLKFRAMVDDEGNLRADPVT